MTKRTKEVITLGDVFDAMEQDGYPQAFHYLVKTKSKKILGIKYGETMSACAIGQAALNLGVDPRLLYEKLPSGIRSAIIYQNDVLKVPVDKIAKNVRSSNRDYLALRIKV